jgi:hypothetical protein
MKSVRHEYLSVSLGARGVHAASKGC